MHDYTQKNTLDKKTDKIILELRPKIITETIFTNLNLTFNIWSKEIILHITTIDTEILAYKI